MPRTRESGDGKTEFGRDGGASGHRIDQRADAQAKGRVERANQTLQDRLIKEMRLRNISSIEAARLFCQGSYLSIMKSLAFRARRDLGAPPLDEDGGGTGRGAGPARGTGSDEGVDLQQRREEILCEDQGSGDRAAWWEGGTASFRRWPDKGLL